MSHSQNHEILAGALIKLLYKQDPVTFPHQCHCSKWLSLNLVLTKYIQQHSESSIETSQDTAICQPAQTSCFVLWHHTCNHMLPCILVFVYVNKNVQWRLLGKNIINYVSKGLVRLSCLTLLPVKRPNRWGFLWVFTAIIFNMSKTSKLKFWQL